MIRRQFLHTPLAALAPPPLPSEAQFADDEAGYWTRLRKEQFLLPEWRSYLNTGSVGSAPKPVILATNQYLEQGASYTKDEYPRWGYEAMESHRDVLARFLGTSRGELALTHNATESMNLIASGMDLQRGDEVLLTDQEHPSGKGCWLLQQARRGIRVREAKLPVPPEREEDLLEVILREIRPETKVLSFSGITTHTGLRLPVKRICAAARERGLTTVVDGAHMPGQVPLRIDDLGCDAFAGSLHKWMLTPPGCGVLYVRKEFQTKLWPTIVVDGWQNAKDAVKYMQLGCNNRAEWEGALAAVRWIEEIGRERIEKRIHQLARMTYERARQIPYLRVLTAADERLYGGMVAFEVDRPDYAPLWKKLAERKIWTLRGPKIRISTHIHTRPEDIERFFDTMKEVFG